MTQPGNSAIAIPRRIDSQATRALLGVQDGEQIYTWSLYRGRFNKFRLDFFCVVDENQFLDVGDNRDVFMYWPTGWDGPGCWRIVILNVHLERTSLYLHSRWLKESDGSFRETISISGITRATKKARIDEMWAAVPLLKSSSPTRGRGRPLRTPNVHPTETLVGELKKYVREFVRNHGRPPDAMSAAKRFGYQSRSGLYGAIARAGGSWHEIKHVAAFAK